MGKTELSSTDDFSRRLDVAATWVPVSGGPGRQRAHAPGPRGPGRHLGSGLLAISFLQHYLVSLLAYP